MSSGFGTRCDACGNRGYVTVSSYDYEPICECYDSRYDPGAGCESLYDAVVTDVSVTDTFENVRCVAWQNPLMGFYEPVSNDAYGGPNPQIPSTCVVPYGPPPGSLIETDPPYLTCGTLGGPDPEALYGVFKDSSFKTCSDHGTWNSTGSRCDCDSTWDVVAVGAVDWYGNPAYTCGTCMGSWGPLPPDQDPGPPWDPPYCYAPFIENERGVRLECSGHGQFEYGTCICYQSPDSGFWDLVDVLGTKTCLTCAEGYGPPGSCVSATNATYAPTDAFPTTEPTFAPTRNSSCTPCPRRGMGSFSIVPYGVNDVIWWNGTTDSACGYGAFWGVLNSGYSLRFENVTSSEDLGYELCDRKTDCVAFSWTDRGNGTTDYTYFNGTDFGVAVVETGGSSMACVRTDVPTRAPTPYPTHYPTRNPAVEDG